jgi:hypothetical protein
MELYVLATLTQRQVCSTALLAGVHPDAQQALPSRSLRSSLARALRKLEAAGRIESIRRDGCTGWRLKEFISGDRMRVAYHEAGHAVIAKVLSVPVKYATIKPRKGESGHVMLKTSFFKDMSKDAHKRSALVSLAGRFAETDLFDCSHIVYDMEKLRRYGASVDRKHVRSAVTKIVGSPSEDGRLLWVFRPDRRAMRARLEREAKRLVREHAATIESVAKRLIEQETLSSAQLDEIICET